MVKDMASSGMKILLVGGDGWKSVFQEKNQVTIVPPCTHDRLTDYYMNSRAVVSTNCSNGANERTFDAQSCGAISIAENSVTLENNFEDMKDIIFYDRLNLINKVTVIEEAIKNKTKGILISEEGHQNFINNNTWKHRASNLYKVLEKTYSNKVSMGCS